MVGGAGTGFDEDRTAGPKRLQEALVGRRVDPRDLGQLGDVVAPGGSIEVGHGVGPEGGKHPLAQTVRGEPGMLPQIRGRGVGGGDDLDVEPVEQCARAELSVGDALGDPVIDRVSRFGAGDQFDPEHLDQLVFQPVAGRRAAEELPVLAEGTPDLARVGLDRAAVEPRYAQAGRLDALGGQHPEHVVVGNDQQLGRVGERAVVGEDLRFHMPVHADQRQVFGLVVDLASDAALFGREGAARGQDRAKRTPSRAPCSRRRHRVCQKPQRAHMRAEVLSKRRNYLPPVVAMPLTRNRWPNRNTRNSGIKVTTDMANIAPQLLPAVASRNERSATGTV